MPSIRKPVEPWQKILANEADPSGLRPSDPGAKLDAGKPRCELLEDFGLALLEVSNVCTYGAVKYSDGGWQYVKDAVRRYTGAMLRHFFKGRYEEIDPDTGISHDAHLAWNALARLELKLRARHSVDE